MAKNLPVGRNSNAMTDFLEATPEVATLNQYWYSPRTIGAIVSELESGACGLRVAFLSTPSVYFSLPEASAVRRASYCFDLDEQWASEARFRRFDFNDERVDDDLAGTFDCCVVDPPFITRDVWARYASCVRSALKAEGGRVLLTTVGENEAMLRTVLGPLLGAGLRKTRFMPAMQRAALPYQYSLYVNYDLAAASALAAWNDEVPDEFRESNAARMPDEDAAAAAGGAAADDAPVAGTSLTFEELLERELRREGGGGPP